MASSDGAGVNVVKRDKGSRTKFRLSQTQSGSRASVGSNKRIGSNTSDNSSVKYASLQEPEDDDVLPVPIDELEARKVTRGTEFGLNKRKVTKQSKVTTSLDQLDNVDRLPTSLSFRAK